MKSSHLSIILLFCTLISSALSASSPSFSDTVYYELWDISSLELIGGHDVTVLGDPQVVPTEIGDAVQFDGEGDRLLVDFNPIMDAKEFTVELVFKPDACYPDNTDPRFLHIMDPDDPEQKRVMIELRIDASNQCYMDGFMKTDAGSLALIDEGLVHPTEVWQHVAITYKDSTLTTYFNGVEELSGTLHYSDAIVNTTGKTSMGARMNEVKFYSGLIKTLKVTHSKLAPEDFTFIHDSTGTSVPGESILSREEGFEFFPVPADQSVSLNLSQNLIGKNDEIQIYNSSGVLVHARELGHTLNMLTIDTSHFPNGVYFLRFRTSGQTDVRRIIILH